MTITSSLSYSTFQLCKISSYCKIPRAGGGPRGIGLPPDGPPGGGPLGPSPIPVPKPNPGPIPNPIPMPGGGPIGGGPLGGGPRGGPGI